MVRAILAPRLLHRVLALALEIAEPPLRVLLLGGGDLRRTLFRRLAWGREKGSGSVLVIPEPFTHPDEQRILTPFPAM